MSQIIIITDMMAIMMVQILIISINLPEVVDHHHHHRHDLMVIILIIHCCCHLYLGPAIPSMFGL